AEGLVHDAEGISQERIAGKNCHRLHLLVVVGLDGLVAVRAPCCRRRRGRFKGGSPESRPRASEAAAIGPARGRTAGGRATPPLKQRRCVLLKGVKTCVKGGPDRADARAFGTIAACGS